jgi:hypothetical protein
MSDQPASEFEKAAVRGSSGLLGDFWGFLRSTRKWWLLPILTVLMLFGLLMLLSATAAAPLIYTLW